MKITTINKVLKNNAKAWDKMPIRHMHPDIHLIIAQKNLFPDSKNKKLLYIGFGEGQNLLYLAKEGFECYGTEIAKSRIRYTKKILKKNHLKAELKLVNSNQIPYPDNFFDIIIAWQSIAYNTKEGLKEILAEIHRTLKPKGGFLSAMPSVKHNLCAKKIAPNTYQPIKSRYQSNCILYCFNNTKNIKNLYKDFKNFQIGYYDSYLFKTRNFFYVIYCKK